jgi:hypothetical protein
MEAISAMEKATAVAPKATRMHPYTMDEGPPLSSANWKVMANASHEQSTMMLK